MLYTYIDLLISLLCLVYVFYFHKGATHKLCRLGRRGGGQAQRQLPTQPLLRKKRTRGGRGQKRLILRRNNSSITFQLLKNNSCLGKVKNSFVRVISSILNYITNFLNVLGKMQLHTSMMQNVKPIKSTQGPFNN